MRSLILPTLLLLSAAFAQAATVPPHMDLEMSSAEYEALIAQEQKTQGGNQKVMDALQVVVDFGKRNLDWLKFMNGSRPEDAKLSFSSAATATGTPIDAPSEYNETIVLDKFRKLLDELPPEMKSILQNGAAFTQNPPIEEKSYLDFGRKIDRLYQTANRWRLMQPYLEYLAARKAMDVRGYYFLNKENELAQKLQNFSAMPEVDKAKYKEWLLELCLNDQRNDLKACQDKFDSSLQTQKLFDFFKTNFAAGKAMYEHFFLIPRIRTDVIWTTTNLFQIPFTHPDNLSIENFLRDNIEDEWKLNDWHLRLNFQAANDTDDYTTHVEFEPGALPHVNEVAGSIITMDANAPLTEYDVRWTIRHEFGHVLGFVDCYIEFYDSSRAAIVQYQLDLDNLMCSRKGHLQQIHFDQLKKNYFSTKH